MPFEMGTLSSLHYSLLQGPSQAWACLLEVDRKVVAVEAKGKAKGKVEYYSGLQSIADGWRKEETR